MFSEIYSALNKMDRDIHRADQISEETETTRREWIANITHDLKTPLSPIKGYAELLADNSDKEKQAIQEYASVIRKNINHTENLINDLKLTCCQETFGNEEAIRKMMECQKDMRIPEELLPVCPHCGKPMTMNLRSDGRFVQDEGGTGQQSGTRISCVPGKGRGSCFWSWVWDIIPRGS